MRLTLVALTSLIAAPAAAEPPTWQDATATLQPPEGWIVRHDALTQTLLLRPAGDDPGRASVMLHYTARAPALPKDALAKRLLDAAGGRVEITSTTAVGTNQGLLLGATITQGSSTRRGAALVLRHTDGSQLTAVLLARPKALARLGGERRLYEIAKSFRHTAPGVGVTSKTPLTPALLQGTWHDETLATRAARFDPLTRTLPKGDAPNLTFTFAPGKTYELSYRWRLISGACISTATVKETGRYEATSGALTLRPASWEGSVRLCGAKPKPWKSQATPAARVHGVIGIAQKDGARRARLRLQGACASYMLHPWCDRPHEMILTRGSAK